MSKGRHLRAVGSGVADDNGEVVSPERLVQEIEQLQIDFGMAQRDVRSKNRRIAEMERNRARERLEHPDRELILRVCNYWWRKCRAGHPRIKWDSDDRFDAVAALVELEDIIPADEREPDGPKTRRVYEPAAFKQAVDGAAFDHYSRQRKNGTWVHYDDLTLICRSVARFEEFRARAPR